MAVARRDWMRDTRTKEERDLFHSMARHLAYEVAAGRAWNIEVKCFEMEPISMKICNGMTVLDLKYQIQLRTGTPMKMQRLMAGSRPMGDSDPLDRIAKDQLITVTGLLRGGGPAIQKDWKSGPLTDPRAGPLLRALMDQEKPTVAPWFMMFGKPAPEVQGLTAVQMCLQAVNEKVLDTPEVRMRKNFWCK